MGYLVRWTNSRGEPVAVSFAGRNPQRNRDDALALARSAIADRGRDVEVLDNGKPVPKSEWAKAKV